MSGQKIEAQYLKLLYERNEENWRFFLDYRFRFIVRYAIAVVALTALAGWLIKIEAGTDPVELPQSLLDTKLLFLPFLFLSAVSLVWFMIEKRTSHVLIVCQKVGEMLERRFFKQLGSKNVPLARTIHAGERRRYKRKPDRELWNDLEETLAGSPGFFTGLTVSFKHTVPHATVLRCLYAVGFVLSLTVSISLLRFSWSKVYFHTAFAVEVLGYFMLAAIILWIVTVGLNKKNTSRKPVRVTFKDVDEQVRCKIIQINREDKANSLNIFVLTELRRELQDIPISTTVLCLSHTAGAFCGGLDQDELDTAIRDTETAGGVLFPYSRLLHQLWNAPVPTVCLVGGNAVGGGLALAASCDVVVACEGATFKIPQGKYKDLAVIVPPILKKLRNMTDDGLKQLTGSWIDAAKAKEIGLVDEVVRDFNQDAMLRTAIKILKSKELLNKDPDVPRGGQELKTEFATQYRNAISPEAAQSYLEAENTKVTEDPNDEVLT